MIDKKQKVYSDLTLVELKARLAEEDRAVSKLLESIEIERRDISAAQEMIGKYTNSLHTHFWNIVCLRDSITQEKTQ